MVKNFDKEPDRKRELFVLSGRSLTSLHEEGDTHKFDREESNPRKGSIRTRQRSNHQPWTSDHEPLRGYRVFFSANGQRAAARKRSEKSLRTVYKAGRVSISDPLKADRCIDSVFKGLKRKDWNVSLSRQLFKAVMACRFSHFIPICPWNRVTARLRDHHGSDNDYALPEIWLCSFCRDEGSDWKDACWAAKGCSLGLATFSKCLSSAAGYG